MVFLSFCARRNSFIAFALRTPLSLFLFVGQKRTQKAFGLKGLPDRSIRSFR